MSGVMDHMDRNMIEACRKDQTLQEEWSHYLAWLTMRLPLLTKEGLRSRVYMHCSSLSSNSAAWRDFTWRFVIRSGIQRPKGFRV